MRVNGHIQLSKLSFEAKHPTIICKGPFAWLLVEFHHQCLKHPGVSLLMAQLCTSYWIVSVRCIAKHIHCECIQCQVVEAKSFEQPSPPLPDLPVQESPPFMVTSLDYAGPLYCKESGGQKFCFTFHVCSGESSSS